MPDEPTCDCGGKLLPVSTQPVLDPLTWWYRCRDCSQWWRVTWIGNGGRVESTTTMQYQN